MSDEISPELWKRICWAINATAIPATEWNYLQGECHKRNCACRAHWNGDPERALALVQGCIRDSVYRELHFAAVTEPDVGDYQISNVVIKQIKKQLKELE